MPNIEQTNDRERSRTIQNLTRTPRQRKRPEAPPPTEFYLETVLYRTPLGSLGNCVAPRNVVGWVAVSVSIQGSRGKITVSYFLVGSMCICVFCFSVYIGRSSFSWVWDSWYYSCVMLYNTRRIITVIDCTSIVAITSVHLKCLRENYVNKSFRCTANDVAILFCLHNEEAKPHPEDDAMIVLLYNAIS